MKEKYNTDRHMEYTIESEFPCFERILINEGEKKKGSKVGYCMGSNPWYTKLAIVTMLDFIMLGWIPRLKFMLSVPRADFII